MSNNDLEKRIAALPPEKRELLLRKLNREVSARAEAPSLIPISRQADSFPLSYPQERLWFLDQLEPNNPVYNISGAFRLGGELNLAALKKSLDEIVTRHETLRTNYRSDNGQPRQFVSPPRPVPFQIIDMSDLPAEDKLGRAIQLGEFEARRPFNLQTDLMLRVALVRLDKTDHVLLVTMHHIASDAWSLGVFANELALTYQAHLDGSATSIPALPVQYIDYTIWQQTYHEQNGYSAQLAYWKDQLGGDIPLLDVPTDYPLPAIQTYEGDYVNLKLSPELSTKLKRVSKGEGTLFMTLLAAFKLLLYRYTGQSDILVGIPIAGRNRTETEALIGFFLNTLVLRTEVTAELTFQGLLDRIRQVSLDAYSNQDIPFEKLLIELRPDRDPARTPLFQVFFNMLNINPARIDMPGLSLELLTLPENGSKFDITLYLADLPDGINLTLVYKTRLFAPERIQEMLAQYHTLLEQIVLDPSKPITQYTLITESSKKVLPDPSTPLSTAWNGAAHEILHQRASADPKHIALIDKNTTWNYQELDEWSNRLANHLILNGIQKGSTVAIYGYRCASLVWAIMGILKTGSAFLILDPQYPGLRHIEYLEQARPAALLSLEEAGKISAELSTYIDSQFPNCIFELPNLNTAKATDFLADIPATYPQIPISPEDVACVTFTSGSTGKPKGIRGKHGALTHFLPWQAETFDLRKSDIFSMLSGLAHDPIQRDIITAIWVGATICIPDPINIGTPGWLANWMSANQISVTHLTPSMGELIVEASRNITDQEATIPSWRRSFFIGEKLYRRDVDNLLRIAPNLTIINMYGSTETQRAVGYYLVPRLAAHPKTTEQDTPSGQKEIIPVGEGMQGCQVLVLNADMEMAGVGEIGEIFIRSHHLALGYLIDQQLTSQKFLSNPFTNTPGDRLYRTGDLGRFRPDGLVEFAGRADDQVKIRGFRVEPAEIEAAICSHPSVKDAVVLLHEDPNSPTPYLTAYFTTDSQKQKPTSQQLRSYLHAHLPLYMLPSVYIELPAIPLTPNGKVNKRALPKPEPQMLHSEEYEAVPTNETEERLLKIWREVLGTASIGIKDDFFELGGHSLLAIQLFTRIEAEFQVKLPLITIFQAPTVERLAAKLVESEAPVEILAAVPIKPAGTQKPFFIVHGFGGGVLGYADLIRLLDDDQPVYGLDVRGFKPDEEPHTRIEDMAAYYIESMRAVQPEGPYYLGGYCYGGIVAYEIARQLADSGDEVGLLSVFEGYAPIKLEHNETIANPKHLITFARNLPGWFEDFSKRGLRRILAEIQRRVRLATKVALNSLGIKVEFTLEDLVENAAQIPESHRKIFESQIIARIKYEPAKFPGRVTLFRVRNMSMTKATDQAMGWGHLAEGGVDVKIVPGQHFNMLQPPFVATLAEELSASLHQTQSHPD